METNTERNTNLNSWAIPEEMFNWIKDNLEEGKTILEFGSGKGTIELTKHWKVYSVEQNSKWVGLAPDSNYIHAPLKGKWYDPAIVFSQIPKEYDLILIDGPMGPHFRSGIDKYWDKFNTNVPLLFDDTHRKSDRDHAIRVANLLKKEWKEIKGWQKNFIVVF
tara:strand:+ start:2714 stop:3202 length:489 start_codon:yes stop_codon:yes gene_type:complete